MKIFVPVLVCAALASCCLAQQGLTTWVGKAGGYRAFANMNPFEFMSVLADMSPKQQHLMLVMLGEGFKESANMTCNIFGGEAACQPLPADSALAKACPHTDLKVDCAYHNQATADVRRDAVENLKAGFTQREAEELKGSCCEAAVRQWFCSATPPCGSFEKVVETAILPAFKEVTDAKDHGKAAVDSIAAALPTLLDSMALSLPCREMCENILDTCACGDPKDDPDFGDLIEAAIDGLQAQFGMGDVIPDGFTARMFGSLSDRSLCSMFAWSNSTGFVGACEPRPTHCSMDKRWCGHGSGADSFQQLMAFQLAKTIFGWVSDAGGPGLLQQRQALIEKADAADIKHLEDKYLRHAAVQQASQRRSSSGGFAIGAFVGAAACIAILAAAALAFMHARRHFDCTSGSPPREGYIPMTESVGSLEDHVWTMPE